MKRGIYLFRYECAWPDCPASVIGEGEPAGNAPGPPVHPSSYTPPSPWLAEFGGIWCPAHRPQVEDYRTAQREWGLRYGAFVAPLQADLRRKLDEWQAQDPAPSAPWKRAEPKEPDHG